MRIRVVSYNIHKGFTWSNSKLILNEIKHIVRQSNADLVLLQEVMGLNGNHANSKNAIATQFEYLADQVWSHYAYGQNAVYEGGDHGNAILSHFPIQEWKNTNISTNRFEQRGFLYAKVEVPESTDQKSVGQIIHLVCLHLDLLERGRRKQIQNLCEFIKKSIPAHEPLIVAGDFNDWSGRVSDEFLARANMTEVFKSLNGRYELSFPAVYPFLSLDRIFVKNIKIIEGKILHEGHGLSDHVPLFAELELN